MQKVKDYLFLESFTQFQLEVTLFKFETKQKAEEYKRQKDEYIRQIELQQEIKQKAEKEYKSKIANMEIENFLKRVITYSIQYSIQNNYF